MRACPRCEVPLEVRQTRGVEVDVCGRCGGLHLDASEFDSLVAQRFHDKKLESTFAFVAEPTDDPLTCPGCSAGMHVVEFDDDVELDRCPDCGGIWVDGSERSKVAQPRSVPADDLDDYVVCAGCGAGEERRLCIRRMSAWWCEACVVAGNHPGPEAQLVGRDEKLAAAAAAFSKATVDQHQARQANAERKERRARRKRKIVRRLSGPEGTTTFDLLEIFARKLDDWLFR